MKNAKENKGITLVALIITVIILLILAGVTISLVIGDNGIITRSKETSKISFEKDVQESLELAIADLEISKTESGEKVEITDLLEKGYINEEGVINIDKLLGKKGQYGNGTNKQDVFIIENNELWYYEKSGEGKKISKLSNLGYLPTLANEFQIEATTINLAEYKTYYGDWITGKKEAPLETYVIPNKINETTLDTVGHFNAPNIKRIIIKEGFKKIETCAFSECTKLKNIEIPNTVTVIKNLAFGNCSSLKNINIPNSVLYISECAFWGCSSLENIKLPKEITRIQKWTFNSCTNLNTIVIPKNVKYIDMEVFKGCTALKTINYEGTKEEWEKINIDSSNNDKLANITINYNYKYEE